MCILKPQLERWLKDVDPPHSIPVNRVAVKVDNATYSYDKGANAVNALRGINLSVPTGGM